MSQEQSSRRLAWTTGGHIFSRVPDRTSCLMLIEAVASPGGLSGTGPVTFLDIGRWRRGTFGGFTPGMRPGTPQPASASPHFDSATRAADVAAQDTAVQHPLAAGPLATQGFPCPVGLSHVE